jgi:hypothetical protein
MVSIEKGLVVVAGERSVLIPPSFITLLQDRVMKEKGEGGRYSTKQGRRRWGR